MNIVNINDENFKNTEMYREFINNNPSEGYLRIRAYAANGAVPISDLKIVVSITIDDTKIIFFEGYTDASGLISKIALPAPLLSNNLTIPNTTTYDITSTYLPDNVSEIFNVDMYEGICVVQNINIVPKIARGVVFYGR